MLTAEQSEAAAEECEALHRCSFIYDHQTSQLFLHLLIFSLEPLNLLPGGSKDRADAMTPPAVVVLTRPRLRVHETEPNRNGRSLSWDPPGIRLVHENIRKQDFKQQPFCRNMKNPFVGRFWGLG